MGSNHNVGVARIRPLGHPSAFFEILQEGCNHAANALWSEQGEHAVVGAESVPDRVSGITLSFVDCVIKGAIVATVLREDARVEQHVIHRRVNQRLVHIRGAADLNLR